MPEGFHDLIAFIMWQRGRMSVLIKSKSTKADIAAILPVYVPLYQATKATFGEKTIFSYRPQAKALLIGNIWTGMLGLNSSMQSIAGLFLSLDEGVDTPPRLRLVGCVYKRRQFIRAANGEFLQHPPCDTLYRDDTCAGVPYPY